MWLQITAARPEPLAVVGVGRLKFGAEIQCGLAILLGVLGQVYRLAPANAVALQRDHLVPQRILAAGESLQDGSPPDVEVSVVLPGIADAAMHLNVLQRHPLISGQRVSGGHRRGQLGLRTVSARSVPGRGDGELGVDKHVRAVMFDRLKRADGPTELLAAGGVGRGHLGTGAQTADGFGRGQQPENARRYHGGAGENLGNRRGCSG